jgi:hypothetical protein
MVAANFEQNNRYLLMADTVAKVFLHHRSKISGCKRGDGIIMWGTTATSDGLTSDFGDAFEDASINDCRLVRLLAEN